MAETPPASPYIREMPYKIRYHNGMYYAVVKPLGTAGYQQFNGTATLTVT